MLNKEKNFVLVDAESANKVYKFDINTGVIYGLRGKPVKNFPSAFRANLFSATNKNVKENWLTAMIRFALASSGDRMIADKSMRTSWGAPLKCEQFQLVADIFTVADRLDAIHYPVEDNYGSYYNYCLRSNDFDNLRIVNRYFKQFTKEFNEHPDECTIGNFVESYRRKAWETDNEKILRNIDSNLKEWLYYYRNDIPEDKIDYYIYFISHGLADFFGLPTACTGYYSNGHSAFKNMISNIGEVFEKANEMNYPVTKDNYFTQAVNINKMYEVFKMAKNKDQIIQAYANRRNDLQFETNDFMVVIPTCEQDFIDEASQQNNCVYTNYMRHVMDGNTFVVFVRKKSCPKKSYVTCEVSKNGKIRQYLTTNNKGVKDSFHDLYAEHLDDIW